MNYPLHHIYNPVSPSIPAMASTPTNRRPGPPLPRPVFQNPGKPASTIPIPTTPEELPAKYKAAHTRVKLIIIALPIAIVSSYMLYKRVYLGEQPRAKPIPDSERRRTIREINN
ncbi:hypothetical protein TWF173_008448 [Orbilia oligospora]|uniref:Uncharacterized protein n=2 Tax=Orbilia oligospora TaxID=2813651 RepID=G1WY03_ARTOA|nr:hypothetical protein AOL_s00004g163 [Orbilia oligospora ATCC 24927]KAF3242651.1 hypothetical protein TWF217_011509 [Orbilia oligospora]EGX54130.1 hypothetical protein AOL_s00004g163 [Orbilia oligospora ATCC 24927]KAF3286122.1 hypothetical protein TWF970_009673 [Orbilia oligospora]KAF3286388.1 hypothetical protein TWF132_008957 [Orbilia oligospora]KAF3311303.1 hypothetical protein TWF173_008448 [Orbilia oligospora]